MAQSGLWDVEGVGLQKIEDRDTAQAILARVNSMNSQVPLKALGLTLALALTPAAIAFVTRL